MESLSQELVDAIIEEVSCSFFHHGPSPSLCATSLVCRSWLPTSQRLLFHSLDLTFSCEYQEQPRNYQQLYGALLESPHLAGYVKHLTVTLTTTTLSMNGTLPLFLRKLGNLEKLSLYTIPDDVYWGDLDLDLRQAVFWVFQLPSMRLADIHCPFVNMNELTSFLHHTRFLPSLCLYRGFHQLSLEEEVGQQEDVAGQQENDDEHERLDPGHLSQLCLDFYFKSNYPTFIAWLLGPRSYFIVENIHTLTISSIRHLEDGNSIHQLLHAIATPLKRLVLAMHRDEVADPMAMIFDSEEKSLVFWAVFMSGTAADQLYWFLRLISLFNIFGRIEAVRLTMEPTHPSGVSGQEWSAWGTVDTILAESQFKFLKTLLISWEEAEPWVETADVAAMFPLLSMRRLCAAPIEILLIFEAHMH